MRQNTPDVRRLPGRTKQRRGQENSPNTDLEEIPEDMLEESRAKN